MEFLSPLELTGLSRRRLREYEAQLGRHKTFELPWEGIPARERFWNAALAVEKEWRRRGTQMQLFEDRPIRGV